MSFEISVVIPAFNRAHLIPATLNSVLTQTHPAAEVVVVDDGSTDDTEAVIRSRYPSVIYKRVPNAGAPNARNVGVQLSTAPWLAFLDSDDLWAPNKLARHAQLHALAPDLEYSFTNFRIVTDGQWQNRTKFEDAPQDFFADSPYLAPGLSVVKTSLYDRLLRFQPIFPSCFVIARSRFGQVGGWEPSLGRNVSEDLEFTLRCSHDTAMGIIDEPLVGIRKHGGNFSGDKLRLSMAQIDILKFVDAHHPLSDANRAEVKRQISLRSRDAADLAFNVAEFELVRELLSTVKSSDRTLRQRIKSLISSLPRPAADVLARSFSR